MVLEASALAPFEVGTRLDALLCYSTWSLQRRQKLSAAICAEVIAYTIEVEPHAPRAACDQRARRDKHQQNGALESDRDRLHRRPSLSVAELNEVPAKSSGVLS
jgi:hypothetical protein